MAAFMAAKAWSSDAAWGRHVMPMRPKPTGPTGFEAMVVVVVDIVRDVVDDVVWYCMGREERVVAVSL